MLLVVFGLFWLSSFCSYQAACCAEVGVFDPFGAGKGEVAEPESGLDEVFEDGEFVSVSVQVAVDLFCVDLYLRGEEEDSFFVLDGEVFEKFLGGVDTNWLEWS